MARDTEAPLGPEVSSVDGESEPKCQYSGQNTTGNLGGECWEQGAGGGSSLGPCAGHGTFGALFNLTSLDELRLMGRTQIPGSKHAWRIAGLFLC